MEKLSYNQFALEITRKCNMKCEHCSRGDAQNLSMTDEILYKTLDNLGTVQEFLNKNIFTGSIYLYGGEPFLEPDIIQKFVDYIIYKDIFLLFFWSNTNGSIVDDSIADNFKRIAEHINKCRKIFYRKEREIDNIKLNLPSEVTKIEISKSFHNNTNNAYRAKKFYQEKCGGNTIVNFFDSENDNFHLSYSGRAKKLLGKGIHYFHLKNNHCAATVLNEKYVQKTICVSANGNVFLGLDYEYSIVDSDNMGNILNDSLYSMSIKWNWRYPFLYNEMKKYLKYKSVVFNYENNRDAFKENVILDIDKYERILKMYDLSVNVRKELHQKWKYLDFKDILMTGDCFLIYSTNGLYRKEIHGKDDYSLNMKNNVDEYMSNVKRRNEEAFYNKFILRNINIL